MLGKQLRTRWMRTVAIGLLGVLVGACVFGLPALASTSRPNAHTRQGRHERPRDRATSSDTASANSRVQAAATAAVQNLVTDGTISQQQANAIDNQVDAGRVDVDQLLASGVLSQSQLNAVENVLGQVKQSFAGSPQSAGDKTRSATANTQAADARVHAATEQAIQGLVSDGTIDQRQADVIESRVDSGVVDPEQLVSSGVVSQSQMNAVGNALAQVKRSFAGG